MLRTRDAVASKHRHGSALRELAVFGVEGPPPDHLELYLMIDQ